VPTRITSPADPALSELCGKLRAMAIELDTQPHWPAEQLRLCGEYGVYEWFLQPEWGGQGWSDADVVRGYHALSAACLTTAFILTQRIGACRRIAGAHCAELKQRWLPPLVRGDIFATVGISHLTTSRRHVARPVLSAERAATGFILNGSAPWVTGSGAADVIVVAATVTNAGEATDEQLLVALPTSLPGVVMPPPLPLVGLASSSTGPLELHDVAVPFADIIAGPAPNVMQSGVGGRAGGLETSTLALGVASAAAEYLQQESKIREDLTPIAAAFTAEHNAVLTDLLSAARGLAPCSNEELRGRANSLVLRTTQAALTAAKGAGYITGHPAGRWCREAMFFLVWSCPQPVARGAMCELAGLG
jgi:alkylation response protein AidB-like acyl-CoA dehydrogenase